MSELKAIMLERGLTQRELAQKINQSSSTISQILGGFRKPWPKLRREIAEALQVPEGKLFNEEGDCIKTSKEYVMIPVK